jgi:hypothetical protein
VQGCQRWRPCRLCRRAATQQLHCAGPAVPSMPCQSSTSNIARCSSLPLCLTTVRSIHTHYYHPYLHPPPELSLSRPSTRPAHLTHTHTHTHLTPPHLTSLPPGDRACVVAVRSFPLLVVLLRRRIHTPVSCLCSALCEFEPPRYPGTHTPSAPALRSLAACADTISLPPPDNTLSSAHLHDLKPSCPAFSAIPIPVASIHTSSLLLSLDYQHSSLCPRTRPIIPSKHHMSIWSLE